ncbi:ParA-like protein [hydrothermal vent metagenome]|uniref:ParA-like protein n=1 Tax=hydrothermal vent metagenome TaxID=652676 RepID=A0A3B1A1P8_9ZZZZ
MQRILVLNSKGGCGKTTIATNLASCYASEGLTTALVDHDPQGSSMRWLNLRPKEKQEVYGVPAYSRQRAGVTMSWHRRVLPGSDKVIIDAPAGVMGQQLQELVRQVDIILVPVLPSPIDIHAATRFIEELLLVGKVRSFGVQVAVIANRAKKNTLVYQSLERFLTTLKLPFIATLRDTQNYVRASARGIGIFEMWDQRVQQDKIQWEPLVEWIDKIEPRKKHQSMLNSLN